MLPPLKLIDHSFRGGCYEAYAMPEVKKAVDQARQDVYNQDIVMREERRCG